jgi:hypothetical protein
LDCFNLQHIVVVAEHLIKNIYAAIFIYVYV